MKSVRMTEPKKMANFIALGGIATTSWFDRESFVSWADLENAIKKTWCIKLNPSDAIACECQNLQREDGYIREYIVKTEELKQFFGEMSLPTLNNLFNINTQHAVHNWYNELKRQELTWEQFLTEVTVINNEEARWDTLKQRDKNEGRRCPNLKNKQALYRKKKPKAGLSECAEEFKQGLNSSKEDIRRG